MLLQEFFKNANWLAIGVAALTYWIIGALFYSALFRKPWMAGHKIEMPTAPDEIAKMKKSMPMVMVMGLLMNIVVAIIVGMFVMALGSIHCISGMKLGLALSFLATIPLLMSHSYTMKSMKLWVIDGGYHVISITLMSIIISVWH
ncbi:hypothetical protein BH09BAC5_BH09BAC5_10880 [soil metagenome]